MGAWGEGSLREKRPGVFEIRVAVGVDPVSGRTVQRSFWFHGALEDAEKRRRELTAQFAEYRSIRRAAPFLTVGELLERWLAVQHDWRPSTWPGRSNVKALSADPIAARRVATLRPENAEADLDESVISLKVLHQAEQVRLLVRLAADSGARRGELAALKFSDLDGRVLTIERGVSAEQIGPSNTKRTRRLTLGRTAVELWRASEQKWW